MIVVLSAIPPEEVFERTMVAVFVLFSVLAPPRAAQELPSSTTVPPDRDREYSTYIQENFPNQVFFGDAHLHTAFSADAGLVFATTTPDDAYRFAKGEGITSSQGLPGRLQRPLDFLVVADHSENLGIGLVLVLEENSPIFDFNDWSRTLAEKYAPGAVEAMEETYVQWFGAVNTLWGGDPMAGSGLDRTMWERITDAAERHNQAVVFTAFIGYE